MLYCLGVAAVGARWRDGRENDNSSKNKYADESVIGTDFIDIVEWSFAVRAVFKSVQCRLILPQICTYERFVLGIYLNRLKILYLIFLMSLS